MQLGIYQRDYTYLLHSRDVGISKLRSAPHAIRAKTVACLRDAAHGEYSDTPDFATYLEELLELVQA